MKKSILPDTISVAPLKGEELINIKAAARLANIHPEILAIGRRLVKTPGEAASFKLADPAMVKNANALENAFAKGLRRVVKAFAEGKKAKTFLDYEQKRIVMWVE